MRLLVFGGKGGVGKSSISTATAVKIAKLCEKDDKKVLLISFDMAHNLSDLFNMQIGNNLTQVMSNLWAIEPDPDEYAEEYTHEFSKKVRALMKTMPLVGMMPDLEKYIETAFTSRSIPLALKNSLFFQRILDAEEVIEEVGEETSDELTKMKFDYVVADFPPTGNMIALFEIPQNQVQVLMKYTLETMSNVRKFVRRLRKVTKIFNPFAWGTSDDSRNLSQEILDMLNELEQRGERVTRIMKEDGSLRLVTIAEKPSYEEIKRGAELTAQYIKLDAVHVNRIIYKHFADNCEMCNIQRTNQDRYIEEIGNYFKDMKIWKSHMMTFEPIGVDGLLSLANEVYGEDTKLDNILFPKN